MTEHQEREVKTMALNIAAQFTHEQIIALCAELLHVEIDILRAWWNRRKDGRG